MMSNIGDKTRRSIQPPPLSPPPLPLLNVYKSVSGKKWITKVDRKIFTTGKLLQRCSESLVFTHDQDKQYLKQLERSKEILRLFPHDHEFDKQQLVQLWIADELAEPEHAGKLTDTCFEWLVSEQYIYSSDSSLMYKVNSEKVKSGDKINPRFLILNPKTKHEPTPADILHISVQDDDIDDSLLKALENTRGLRTLLFNSNQSFTLEKMLMEIFMNCESLLVLDLSGTPITELPSSFAKMTRLHYLDLSWTLIELLPESICSFEDLETLRLNGCSNIWRLPRDFKRLTKLKHLEFDVLGNLASMPEGFGSLVNIQTLSAFLVGTQEGCKIRELEKLNSIDGEFCVANLENVEDAKTARLQDKGYIKILELRWTDATLQCDISYDVLESLRPHTELEELQIQLYSGIEFPKWIGDDAFHRLSSITLFKCEHVLVLPSLQKLPSLEYLRLFCLVSVTELDFCCEKGGIGFPKLQTVIIEKMLLLKEWKVSDGDDFPCLVELTIKDCPELSKVPELVYHSSTLKCLVVEDCPEIKKSCLEEGDKFYDKLKHIPDVCIVQDDDEDGDSSCCESLNESDDIEVVYKDGYELVRATN